MRGHAAALLLLLAACGGAPSAGDKGAPAGTKAEAAGAVPVRAQPVLVRRIARSVELSGSLASPDDATIAAEVDGKVVGIRFDLGDRVRQGEVLARINPDEFRYRMQQAEAQREQADANLRRVEQLAKSEMVAAQQLDDARSQASQARAMADLARKKFSDTELRAPFAGAVARKLVTAGEYVKVGQPLFEIVSLDPLKMTGEVPERFLPQVHAGDAVEAHVDAFRGRGFEGKVSRISPAVNPQSRSFTIEARIANREGLLKPGLFAKLDLRLAHEEDVLTVPEAALSSFAGVTRVFVIAGDVAHERKVEVDQHLPDGAVAVRGGDLKAGDPVAVAGLARLAEGVPVSVREAPPGTPPGARTQVGGERK
jgi:membrane fusion protein (multidrug efflux system)